MTVLPVGSPVVIWGISEAEMSPMVSMPEDYLVLEICVKLGAWPMIS